MCFFSTLFDFFYNFFFIIALENLAGSYLLTISQVSIERNESLFPLKVGRNDIVHHPREPMMDLGAAEVIIGSRDRNEKIPRDEKNLAGF